MQLVPNRSMRELLDLLSRGLGIEPEPRPIGLHQALDEMGPNHLTELADELVIEGHPKPPEGFFPMWADLGAFRDQLTDLMVGKEIAFVGGVAVRSYGARRGPTEDYDLLVALGHQKELWAFLDRLQFHYVGPFEIADKFAQKAMEFELDVMRADDPLHTEALASAQSSTWRGKILKIVNKDHLTAMKVKAFGSRHEDAKKARDRRDVIGLLSVGADAEKVRDILSRLAPEFLPALDEILTVPPKP